jgi:RNA polymerase sigma-70 factor (ECF subfamily)
MEKLTAQERAAYLLREAFDYPYGQIADILQSTEPAVRQLVSRARKHVAGERKLPVPETAQRQLLASFLEAARGGDLEALEKLFAADVASISDGNGARQVSRKVVSGAARVAKYIAAFSTWYWDGVDVRWVTTNGQAGAVLRRGDTLLGLVTAVASADGIEQLLWIMNPDKMTAVAAVTK